MLRYSKKTHMVKRVLEFLNSLSRKDDGNTWASGEEIQKKTGLTPVVINDAIKTAEDGGLVQSETHHGTPPFNFTTVTITDEGRSWLESH